MYDFTWNDTFAYFACLADEQAIRKVTTEPSGAKENFQDVISFNSNFVSLRLQICFKNITDLQHVFPQQHFGYIQS